MPDPPNLEPIDESVFEPRPEDRLFKTPHNYLLTGLLVDGLALFYASLVLQSELNEHDRYYRGTCGFLLNTWYCTRTEYRWHGALWFALARWPLIVLLILPPLIGYFIDKRKKRQVTA